jgi:hypothetical protein
VKRLKAAERIVAALKALRTDAWRHTVDWGDVSEREAIEAECDAALAAWEASK